MLYSSYELMKNIIVQQLLARNYNDIAMQEQRSLRAFSAINL